MKTPARLAFFFLATMHAAFAQEATPSIWKNKPPAKPKPVQTYQDVLSAVPADLRALKETKWTRAQRDAANAALKKAFGDNNTSAKLHLKVAEIAKWGGSGMTLYSNVSNQQGYHVRVFGKFTDDWKPKLATLDKGEGVILEGVLSSVKYETLWGDFTLSICLKDCTFTR